MTLRRPIDWSKPNLRLAYLVEGIFLAPDSTAPEFVRWCGPPSRTGSGFTAYATLGPNSYPPAQTKPGELPLAPVSWEPRLSRCSYSTTLGDLKQTIQALSDVTFSVSVGDDDNEEPTTSINDLRDMASQGRWRNQIARLIVVDIDEIDRFEVLVDGTWDRDPNNLGPRGFKMTINANFIEPTRNYLTGQVPATVDNFQTETYSASTWIQSPNGSATPAFRLNPNHLGRWCSEILGGARNDQVWKELIPYGGISTQAFAWVSPRFDQFCYDIVLETNSGLVKLSADAANVIRVFNNNDPLRGPVGTCVAFTWPTGFSWSERGHRAWGKVAGGHPVLRPSGYSDIGYSGDPELGSNIPGGGEASPTNTTTPPGGASDVTRVFQDLIVDPHFLSSPLMLHPDAITRLTQLLTIYNLPFPRNAVLPNDLPDKPLTYREVLGPLMLSIPADLILKQDNSNALGSRKFYAVVRQQPGQGAEYTFTQADLANSDSPPQVVQLSDPDGYYSNDSTLKTEDFYQAPTTGTAGGDQLEVTSRQSVEVVNTLEQTITRQEIQDTLTLDFFRCDSDSDFEAWGRTLEKEKSRPQVVLEAVHGFRSIGRELGDRVQYSIPGVYSGPGHIRGMSINLDSQTVKIRSYHQKTQPEVRSTSIINDKSRVTTRRKG